MAQEMDDFEKEMKEGFLIEASEHLEKAQSLLIEIEKNSSEQRTWDSLFRLAHNIKGTGKTVGFNEISHFAHEVEDFLLVVRGAIDRLTRETFDLLLICFDQFKTDLETLKADLTASLDHTQIKELIKVEMARLVDVGANVEDTKVDVPEAGAGAVATEAVKPKEASSPQSASSKEDTSIRIGLKKVDDLLNNLGEQIILQSALEQAHFDYEGSKERVLRAICQLNKLTYDIQQTAMSFRMINLRQLFSKLERAVRDVARTTGKDVNFLAEGHEQELDKTIIDELTDALVHMVRNSVDHGIETPEQRHLQGKSSKGTVKLSGYRKGGFFYFEIDDDGRGLDKDKILQKALDKGLIKTTDKLSDAQIFELIFESGFSTKEVVSDVSGRGVGMDVVRNSILRVKGAYQIESKVNQGSKFVIRLPLTLAVFNGMVIRLGQSKYILPNSDVEEVVKISPEMIRLINEREQVLTVRDQVMPLTFLQDEIHLDQEARAKRNDLKTGVGIICRINRKPHAFFVDELVNQQRIVYKNLGREAQHIKGAAGATILGDGSVALILEFGKLVSENEMAC